MALKIAEEDNFRRMRKIMTDTTIDENNLIKKGVRRAFEDLNLYEEPDSSSAVPQPTKLA